MDIIRINDRLIGPFIYEFDRITPCGHCDYRFIHSLYRFCTEYPKVRDKYHVPQKAISIGFQCVMCIQ